MLPPKSDGETGLSEWEKRRSPDSPEITKGRSQWILKINFVYLNTGNDSMNYNRRTKSVSLKKQCDQLWKKLVLLKAKNRCEKCGKTEGIQAHHIIPRTNYALRHDPENGVALCIKHHLYWAHKDALQFAEWITSKRNLEYLETRRYNQSKNDYKLIELKLIQDIEGLTKLNNS